MEKRILEKRTLEELNLLDDFLLGTMVSHEEYGEKFVKILLKIIFGREFDRLTVIPQKVYYGSDTDKHGARLDVYLEEVPSEENLLQAATVYDIEPDQKNSVENKASLPQRTRFYHAKIDAKCLKAGDGYQQLKKVIVIMITSYDPFDRNHMVYTIRNMCEEIPGMPYEDGARTLFLYTNGELGNPPQELKQLLKYMKSTTEDNAINQDLLDIQKMVRQVKRTEEVSLGYMKIFEREQMLVEEGRRAGIEQGIERGRALEKANTEAERKRAEEAEAKVEELKAELELLKKSN